jgi:hypothetical protein
MCAVRCLLCGVCGALYRPAVPAYQRKRPAKVAPRCKPPHTQLCADRWRCALPCACYCLLFLRFLPTAASYRAKSPVSSLFRGCPPSFEPLGVPLCYSPPFWVKSLPRFRSGRLHLCSLLAKQERQETRERGSSRIAFRMVVPERRETPERGCGLFQV